MWTVGEIMERHVVTVPAEMPVTEVARLMAERRISGVPVVEEQDRVLGVVSASDVVRRAAGGVERLTAADIMTPGAYSVAPDDAVWELARLLVRAGIHRALVMEQGRLVGIVSTLDVLRAVAEDAQELAKGAAAP